MKLFITLLLTLMLGSNIFASQIALLHNMPVSEPYTGIEIVTEIDEEGNLVYHIVGYTVLSALPTAVKYICVMTGANENICDAIKDVFSDLISLSSSSQSIKKGANSLFKWAVSKEGRLGKVLLTTSSLGIAQGLRTLLQAYTNECTIKFSSISASPKVVPHPIASHSKQSLSECKGKATIKGNGVRVRRYPIIYTKSSNTITHLNAGTKVILLQRTKRKLTVEGWGENYWYQIQTPSGTKGWVFGGLLKL